jgi:hypothetical protein
VGDPSTTKLDCGALLPIPTLPFAFTVNRLTPEEELTLKIGVEVLAPRLVPCTERIAEGEVVPKPER